MKQDSYHTSRALRALGHRVIFRAGRVIVDAGSTFRADIVHAVISTTTDGGRWLSRPLEQWPGATPLECLLVSAVEDCCYCESCSSGCDYCQGARVVPS